MVAVPYGASYLAMTGAEVLSPNIAFAERISGDGSTSATISPDAADAHSYETDSGLLDIQTPISRQTREQGDRPAFMAHNPRNTALFSALRERIEGVRVLNGTVPDAVNDLFVNPVGIFEGGTTYAELYFSEPYKGGSDITGYSIEYSDDNFITVHVCGELCYIDPPVAYVGGLQVGVTYYFRVFAINVYGASAPSNVVSMTPYYPGQMADGVIGQFDENGEPSFTHGLQNASLLDINLGGVAGLALDYNNHKLYLSDLYNDRVLRFALDEDTNVPISTSPELVFGQSCFTCGGQGQTLNQMNMPSSLALDAINDILFVLDQENYRILKFENASEISSNGPSANAVIGANAEHGYRGNCGMSDRDICPILDLGGYQFYSGLALDTTQDRLYLADSMNHRIIGWNGASTLSGYDAADVVIGKLSFTDTASYGTTQSSFGGGLTNLSFDPAHDRLYAVEMKQDGPWFAGRVLEFDGTRSAFHASYHSDNDINPHMPKAARVFGQASFTAIASAPVATAASLSYIASMVSDPINDRLMVLDIGFPADGTNELDIYSRISIFNSVSNSQTKLENADKFIGQPSGSSMARLFENIDKAPLSFTLTLTPDAKKLILPDFFSGSIMSYSVSGSYRNIQNKTDIFAPNRGINPWLQGLLYPSGAAIDQLNHILYVTDGGTVVAYQLSLNGDLRDYTPDYVVGAATLETPFSLFLNHPVALAIDATRNRLYVADYQNSAVFVFSTANLLDMTEPIAVLGQSSLDWYSTGNSATTMNYPSAITYDPGHDRLFVADTYNNRILTFDDVSHAAAVNEAADHVLGQSDFSSNAPGTTRNNLYMPSGLALDDSNRLYVGDQYNHRVMVYDLESLGAPTTYDAINVIGQGDFNSSSPGTYNRLYYPGGLAIDPDGERLWVSDDANYRILEFSLSDLHDGMYPTDVFGQPDFSTNLNSYSATQYSLGGWGIHPLYDPTSDRLYAPDPEFYRVLWFDLATDNPVSPQLLPDSVIGQYDGDGTASFTKSSFFDGPSIYGVENSTSEVAFDTVNHRLFVSDHATSRVLVYDLDPVTNLLTDKIADHVLGQPDFVSTANVPAANSFAAPTKLSYDPNHDRLFVADRARLLAFNFGGEEIVDGMNASYSMLTESFNTVYASGPLVDRTSSDISALAYDSENDRLFVGDAARVLVLDGTNISNGMSASAVLLQEGYDTMESATTQSTTASSVTALTYDPKNDRLYVALTNRVLGFAVGTTMANIGTKKLASLVLGQTSYTSEDSYTGNTFGAATLSDITGMAYDQGNDRLFVMSSDSVRRVQVFDNMSSVAEFMEPADHVLGQRDFTGNEARYGLDGFPAPDSLAYDPISGLLAVSTRMEGPSRIQFFDVSSVTNGEPAVDFISVAAVGFFMPDDVAVDAVNHRLFVADHFMVLVFELDENNDLVDAYADRSLGVNTPSALWETESPDAHSLAWASGLAYDSMRGILYVADTVRGRVLGFDVGSSLNDITDGANAALLFGQSSFEVTDSAATQSGLTSPGGIAIDEKNDRLFVADVYANRVMVYENASESNPGAKASAVIGQPSYTSIDIGVERTASYFPTTVAYDPDNERLFVSDFYNNRVMVYEVAELQEFSEPAVNVLGQPSFGLNIPNAFPLFESGNASASGLYFPVSVAYDKYHKKLLVTDLMNSRALIYDLKRGISNGMAASQVIGQPDFETAEDPGAGNASRETIYTLGSENLHGAAFAPNRMFFVDGLNNRILVFNTGRISSGGRSSGARYADLTGPRISGLGAVAHDTYARVSWDTDEFSDSYVAYGLSDESLRYEKNNGADVMEDHAFTLEDLSPQTTYSYKVCSRDVSGNETCSSVQHFTTLVLGMSPEGTAPKMDGMVQDVGFSSGPRILDLNIQVSDVTETSVTLTWDTDKPSSSLVEYGIGLPFGHDKSVDGLVTRHVVRLTGLTPHSTYFFRIHAQDSSAMRTLSDVLMFATW